MPVSESVSSAASLRDAAIGARLRPDFEILKTLGLGVTSVVYLAREAALRRLVAIKVLRKELLSDASTMRRFVREAQSAARVRHVNVISIYRVGELADGVPYIVMEYVDGRTVREVVGTAGRLPMSEARAVLASTASALIAVHDAGIVHRAVHAGNIYIENKTARPVLGDFSIAAHLDLASTNVARLTQIDIRLGDPRYLSPEQLRDERPTKCSDVYAFGVLSYKVLAGRGPYDGTTDAELLIAHTSGTPVPLSSLRADIDTDLARLLEKCLAKEPARRPRLADLVAALEVRNAPESTSETSRGPLNDFLAELRRRHVYKWIGLGVSIAWAVLLGWILLRSK